MEGIRSRAVFVKDSGQSTQLGENLRVVIGENDTDGLFVLFEDQVVELVDGMWLGLEDIDLLHLLAERF